MSNSLVRICIAIIIGFFGYEISNSLLLSHRHPGFVDDARSHLETFRRALEQFKIVEGRYPSIEEGLSELIKPQPSNPKNHGPPPGMPYLASPEGTNLLIDPWGHPYIYKNPSIHDTNSYDLYSLGPHGKETEFSIDNWTISPRELARVPHIKSDLGIFINALEKFKADCGRLPTSTEGLGALRERPAAIPATNWHGPYVEKIKDPWGYPYLYKYPGRHNANGFDISSGGPNNLPGSNEEIGNWPLPK